MDNTFIGILELVKEDGITLKKVTPDEYAGPCPSCGGRDRFRVWPGKGRYWCRGCGRQGDEIAYLRDFRGMTYQAALKRVKCEGKPGKGIENLEPSNELSNTPNGSSPSLPCDLWQSKAREYLSKAQAYLFKPGAEMALTWLHDRGLTDEAIKAAGLGACRVEQHDRLEAWGLAGSGKKVRLPAGVFIPSLFAGKVVRLRVRRLDPGEPRYVMVAGSYTGPMILNPNRAAAVIVESELDALLINQEAGDLVSSIALGSVSIRPDAATHEALEKAEMILLALDADEAGAIQSRDYWLPKYPKAKRWPVIHGKDPAEAWKNGLSIRNWIIAGLFGSTAAWERYCIKNENTTSGEIDFPAG